MRTGSLSDRSHKVFRLGHHMSLAAGADPGFGQGGAPAAEAESCRCSEAESCERSEQFAAGVQGPLKRALDPGRKLLASLRRQFSASAPGAPP